MIKEAIESDEEVSEKNQVLDIAHKLYCIARLPLNKSLYRKISQALINPFSTDYPQLLNLRDSILNMFDSPRRVPMLVFISSYMKTRIDVDYHSKN